MNEGLFTSTTDEWATPQGFFAALDAEFHFDLDPCSNARNAKCKDFYTIEDDGLTKNWGGAESVLQPAIRQGNQQVGAEMLGGIPEAGHPRGHAHSGKDGYGLLPRLHLPQGAGNPLHPWPSPFQRVQAGGSVSFNGRNLLRQ